MSEEQLLEEKAPPVPEDGKRTPAVETIIHVSLGNIVVDREFRNARLAENEEKGVESLAADIRERGLIHPLTVWKDESGALRLRAGFRRYRALEAIGRTEQIPVLVLPEDTSPLDQQWTNYIENCQRRDLSAYEVACHSQYMIETYSVSGADVARRIGYSTTYVNALLRWRRLLPDEILEAWKKDHPLLTQSLLEKLSHMLPDEAVRIWQELNLGFRGPGGEGDDDDDETMGLGSERDGKAPKRASEIELATLRDAIAEHTKLGPKERKLGVLVVEFALGRRRTIPGVFEPAGRKKAAKKKGEKKTSKKAKDEKGRKRRK
jgi:ParB/RepB/Spo0J family partition protein